MSKLNDVGAERAVLSGIFNYGSAGYDDVADVVTSSSFTDETHQAIFTCFQYILKDTQNAQVDLASLFSAANACGFSSILDRPEERKLIRSIINFPIHQSNLRKMAGKLKKLEIARRLSLELEHAKQTINDVTGDESIDHILGLAENPIYNLTTNLSNTVTSGPVLIGDGIRDYLNYLASKPVEIVGIPTPFKRFNMAIGGGLRRKTVNIIGARPKVGKTTFGDNVGIHVASNLNIPVLNIDTEMSKEDHRVRILANMAQIPIEDIETGKFSSDREQVAKLKDAVAKFEKMPYYYESVAGKPFEEVINSMRRWVSRTVGIQDSGEPKPCLIIYDYLKLLDASDLSKNMQEYQLLGFQIMNLHNFMVRYSVPCLAFVQLNRDGITKEDTDAISGSDRQIWTCSNFSIFKKKSDEEIAEDNSSNRKLVTIVARHGEGLPDGDFINMQFVGKFNQLIEKKTRNEQKSAKTTQSGGFIVNDNSGKEAIPFN